MRATHCHLALYHPPLFGVPFAALSLAWVLVRSVLPVCLTGEVAEDLDERQLGPAAVD